MTILTGRPVFLERIAAIGFSGFVFGPLPPNPPPHSMAITFSIDSGMPTIEAVPSRTSKATLGGGPNSHVAVGVPLCSGCEMALCSQGGPAESSTPAPQRPPTS